MDLFYIFTVKIMYKIQVCFRISLHCALFVLHTSHNNNTYVKNSFLSRLETLPSVNLEIFNDNNVILTLGYIIIVYTRHKYMI